MAQREYRRIVSLSLFPGKPEVVVGVVNGVPEITSQGWLRRKRTEQKTRKRAPDAAPARTVVRGKHALRRVFDMACSAAGLAVFMPLFAGIAVAIKLDDGGPVLYFQERVGKGFRKFRLLKFRSMICGCAEGSLLTAFQDARVTRVGRFLRKYKLDELPQLVNVWKGEMQLVGVRPQVQKFVDIFPNEYGELLQTPPGITDLASLSFRKEELLFQGSSIEDFYVAKILPVKLQIALQYSRKRTFVSDLEILLRTVLGIPSPCTTSDGANFDSAMQSLFTLTSRNSS